MVRMAAANRVTAGENFRRFCFPERLPVPLPDYYIIRFGFVKHFFEIFFFSHQYHKNKNHLTKHSVGGKMYIIIQAVRRQSILR